MFQAKQLAVDFARENLSAQPSFATPQSNLAGQVVTMNHQDTTATNTGPYHYRVGVQQ